MEIQLTEEQSAALSAIKSFLLDGTQDAFILRGSAGTGKTTLIAQLIGILEGMNLSCTLLAPTGRATRILGNKIKQITGKGQYSSSTIHAAIYTLGKIEVNESAETSNDPGIRMIFPLKQEETNVSLFIIDESSMVGDKESPGDVMQFGSGRLLKDIVTFIRMNRVGRTNDHLTKLLFVGDPAQLPPVGERSSQALSDDYLRQEYNLRVDSFDLIKVMRQAHDSAILDRATTLRDAMLAERFNTFSIQPNGQDIEQVDTKSAIELIVQGLRAKDSNVAVVPSNATALEYNRSIREHYWGDANLPIQVGEALLINKNSSTHPLSNGDLVKVTQVNAESELVPVSLRGGHHVELSFRELAVAFRESDGSIIQTPCLVLENLLNSPHRELTALELRALLVDFRNRHPDLHPKAEAFHRTIREDRYFNALQIKYGYAMTCHKAQGGEWNTVLVDFDSNRGVRNASFFRWAYTAITRAAKKLVLVNPPNFTATSGIVWDRPEPSLNSPTNIIKQELTLDPDWDRLTFSASIASLMATHQQLRLVWKAQGINIERLQHLQYCERYSLERNGLRTTVQYHYNGKHRPTRASSVVNPQSDAELTTTALNAVYAILTDKKVSGIQPDEFIQAFLDRLDAALSDSTIKRAAFKVMPYRLRVTVADVYRKAELDFIYDSSSTWTAAQEVGSPGSSHGLYEEIHSLMSKEEPLR